MARIQRGQLHAGTCHRHRGSGHPGQPAPHRPRCFIITYGEAEEELGTAPGGTWAVSIWAWTMEHRHWTDPGGSSMRPSGVSPTTRRQGSISGGSDEAGASHPTRVLPVPDAPYPHRRPLVAQRLGGETTTLLLLEDGDTRLVSVPTDFGLRFNEGTSLYGFSGEGRLFTRVDPLTGNLGRGGLAPGSSRHRFRLQVRDQLTVEHLDAPGAANLSCGSPTPAKTRFPPTV